MCVLKVAVTDIDGILRGKYLAREKFLSAIDGGFGFCNVVLGWGFRRWLYLKLSTGVDFVKTNDVTKVVQGSLQEGPLGLNSADNITQWHQSASLLFQATKRVGGFVEWFSFFSNNSSDNRASNFVDTGLFIYLTPNIQADVRVGERISDRVNSVFTGAGLSLRF